MKKIIMLMLTATSLSAATQAVIFDFGGVMTGAQNREVVIQFLCESMQLSAEEFEKANIEKRQAIKAGKTDEEFWVDFAKARGILLQNDWSQKFKLALKEGIGINHEMYEIVEQLNKTEITVGMLSNIDERLAKILRDLELYEPFEPCLLSCEIGAEKPNPRAFEILLEHLPFPSADIVFIDDIPENVEEAKRNGLDALLFQSTEQIRQELSTRSLL